MNSSTVRASPADTKLAVKCGGLDFVPSDSLEYEVMRQNLPPDRTDETARTRRRRWAVHVVLFSTIFGLLFGCGPKQTEREPDEVDFTLQRVSPETLLPGTRLQIEGRGFRGTDEIRVQLDGSVQGRSVSVEQTATEIEAKRVTSKLSDGFWNQAGTWQGTFTGKLAVEVGRDGRSTKRSLEVEFRLAPSLEPSVDSIEPTTVSFMDKAAVNGSNFLLEGEGQTVLKATGTFTTQGGSEESFDELVLPVEPDRRTRSWYVHTPDELGLRIGTFEGTLKVENWHDGPGETRTGNSISATIEIPKPRIDSVEPRSLSRGQRINIYGTGFVPKANDGRQRTALLVSGTFTDTSGETTELEGRAVQNLDPKYVESGVLEYVLRPSIEGDRKLVGLGSKPGTFRGEVEARIHRDGQELRTPAHSVNLTILPTKQVVYLKYLPGFSESLRSYGLQNVEDEVRERVMEVCERDYREYNVECREEAPSEYADYVTLEIGGRDPNGGNFFGLDNSEGVDDGNLRLDEVIGGRRAQDEKGDQFMFGGVFVESFFVFSPSSPDAIPIASERFDQIFGPFSPRLDGEPVQVDEYPSGGRTQKIERAIRVLGNLVGNTSVHEIGHALGLANTLIPGEVHHGGSTPGLIMNGGSDRPFERRAEIDGTEPSKWGERDSEYLGRILPKP